MALAKVNIRSIHTVSCIFIYDCEQVGNKNFKSTICKSIINQAILRNQLNKNCTIYVLKSMKNNDDGNQKPN